MRTLLRTVALCFFALLSVLLFYFGREHQVFIDNNTIEVEGDRFRALRLVRVTVNDAKPMELMQRERDLVKVVGPSFRFKVEVMDQFGENVEKVIEKELRPGFAKNLMLSLPLIASDRDDYILPPPVYVPPPPSTREAAAKDEEGLVPQENEEVR
ncbi:MAG: hypothetical protein FWE49_03345 [Synergistaceae bacterium]|nr:hypothetical protein [Synergistaceae bacterium]